MAPITPNEAMQRALKNLSGVSSKNILLITDALPVNMRCFVPNADIKHCWFVFYTADGAEAGKSSLHVAIISKEGGEIVYTAGTGHMNEPGSFQ